MAMGLEGPTSVPSSAAPQSAPSAPSTTLETEHEAPVMNVQDPEEELDALLAEEPVCEFVNPLPAGTNIRRLT